MKTRKEIYAEITALGLQETVKKMYGRNFTQVNSESLALVVEKAKKPKKDTVKKPIKTAVVDSSTFDTTTPVSKLDKLIDFLVKKRILLKSEANALK